MFTTKDFLDMTGYFCFLSTDGITQFEVMSKNTEHCWNVVWNDGFFNLYHKHDINDDYHLHGQFNELFDCILEIVDHDEWKLNIWRHKHVGKWKQPKTYFDELIEKYCRRPVYA